MDILRAAFCLFAILLILFFYLLPAVVAGFRKKRNAVAILVLNVAAGWTVVGWVVALVWALTVDVEPQASAVNRAL